MDSTSKLNPIEGQSGMRMRVLWRVSQYKLGSGGKWGEKEAKTLLSKPLDMGNSFIAFNGKVCRDVTFSNEMVGTDRYLSDRYQTTPQILGIAEKTLKVVKTTCRLPGFSEYMRLMDRRLIVRIEGVFFIFEPNINY